MKKTYIVIAAAACIALAAVPANTFTPGVRTQVLSHNAYPDHGKYADRLDRSLAVGFPVIIEEDLAWVDGKSLLIHGARNASPDDPTMDGYFFPKVKPIMEKALKDGNKGNWPLITLYLDIKNDPPEHLAAINQLLDKYDMLAHEGGEDRGYEQAVAARGEADDGDRRGQTGRHQAEGLLRRRAGRRQDPGIRLGGEVR